jgi:hypothetical protein
MSTQPGRPSRPALRLLPILADVFKLRMKAWLFAGPTIAFVVGYVIASCLLEPRIDGDFSSRYSAFFSTSAQVIAAALIALAVEAKVFRASSAPFARSAASLAFVYVLIGELAAVSALAPHLSAAVYEQALRCTIGAGLATFVAVTLVAIYVVGAGGAERSLEDMEKLGIRE